MAALEFRVLGPLEARRNGEPITVTAPKQRKLLSLLLLRANQPVAQGELIADLWDGDVPRTARAAFQNQIHLLRRLLAPGTLERQPAGYVLHVEPGKLDLERFRRLTAEARRCPATERAAKLRESLALWRGPAFPELAGDQALQGEITRLDEERLSALEDRLEADLELGEHAALVAELEELVARHPLRERFWAQLMLALYRAGRQADALATYRRAHDAFVDTLGIEPGVVLREFQRAILVQDRALDDPRTGLGSTLERAAAILPRDPRERAESLYEYGSALERLGEHREAASTLQAAARLAEAAGERGLAERVRMVLSHLALFAEGRTMVEHLAVAETAARVFEDLADDGGLALALRHQAHMLRDTGRAERALGLAQRGIELAQRMGDRGGEATCRRMVAQCAAQGPMPVDEAIALCEAQLEATWDDEGPVGVWGSLAWVLIQAGRIAEARLLYERELETLRERGAVWNLMASMIYAGAAERTAGNLDEAADHLQTVYSVLRAENERGALPAVAGELACVLALRGDFGDARRLVEESHPTVPDDLVSVMFWRRVLALVAAGEGRYEDALRLSGDARACVEPTDWLTLRGETLEEAAVVHRLAGDAAGAAEALAEALLLYERKGHVAGAERVRHTAETIP